MHDFQTIMAAVLDFLGIKAFAKDDSGKSILTEEQKTKLTEKYKEGFVPAFTAELERQQAINGVLENAALQMAREQLENNKKNYAAELAQLRSKAATLEEAEKNLKAELAAKDSKIALLERNPAPEPAPVQQDANMKKTFKPNMALAYNQHYADAFTGKVSAAYAFGNNTDTTDLTGEFAKYVNDVRLDIFHTMLLPTNSTTQMSTIITDKTEVRAMNDQITHVLQQFTPKWTPGGKAKFTPLTIKNYKQKFNVAITPSDIMPTVLGYLYDENLEPKDMPIVKYIIEQLVFPKLAEDREYAIAQGVFIDSKVTKDGDAAGDYLNSMDGYLTIMAKNSLETKPTMKFMSNTEAITDKNILDKVQTFCGMFLPGFHGTDMPVFMDPELIDVYKKAMRAKYPQVVLADDMVVKIEDKKAHLVEMEGMRGTGCFFSTTKENFKHLLSRDPQSMRLWMQAENYDAKIFGEFWEATGFMIADYVYAYISTAYINKYKTAAGITTGAGA